MENEERLAGALANPVRRHLLEIIRARPGVSVSELARAADIYWTSAALHVAQLVRAELVTTTRLGRRRMLFASGPAGLKVGFSYALLAEPACKRVAIAIAEHPGCRVRQLCNITGMSERAVYHHVSRLVAADLVSSARRGAYVGLETTPHALALLHRG